MSKVLHADDDIDNDDAKAIAIPRIFFENSRAKDVNNFTNKSQLLEWQRAARFR